MNVKSQFSIRDLENLSGVKAHTIRIWEKRYELLSPKRTATNIRSYDIVSLKKLLNVTFLYNDGHKISKIARLSENEILQLVEDKSVVSKREYSTKIFKTAMFDFDEALFLTTSDDYISEKSFPEIFFEVFIPLLTDIGVLWQTGAISPTHESFISELIKQKIISNIEKAQKDFTKEDETLFVLFLPYNEIHEIGLLYAKYELILAGFKTVYLGANTPLNSLKEVVNLNDKVIFLSYITLKPEGMTINNYIESFQNAVSLKDGNCDLWLLGNKAQMTNQHKITSKVEILDNLLHFNKRLKELKNN